MSIKNSNYVACAVCQSEESKCLYKFNYKKFGLKDTFILVKCKNCGFIYNINRLETESLAQLYNKDYYIINPKGVEKKAWVLALADYLNKIRPLESKIVGRKLLDVGCGMGFLLKAARDNGWQVCGVDVSLSAVDYAKRNLGLDVKPGRIEEIEFGENKFNLIVTLDLLEHLEEPLQFINRCYCLLEQGGVLIIETPNVASIYKKITGKFWVGFNPYHINFFSPPTFKKLISLSNFTALNMSTTYNDIFSKRNIWRWLSSAAFSSTLIQVLKQFKQKIAKPNNFLDVAELDFSYSSIEKNFNVKNMLESSNNIFAKRLLGDQLVVSLVK